MKCTGRILSLSALALAAMTAAAPAHAGVIFNNFDSGNGYSGNTGWTVSGATSSEGLFWSAMDFTSSSAFTLSEIDVAIGLLSGTNSVTLDLETSSGGTPSGTVLDSWALGSLPALGTCCAIESVFGSDHLAANTQYWIVAIPSSDTWAAWNLNSIGENGNLAQSANNGSSWNLFPNEDQGAFRVLGDTTPEPGTTLIVTSGLALLALLRRKRA